MAQSAEEIKESNVDTKSIGVSITWDGKKLSPATHIVLKPWNASDVVLESANLFIECIFKVTGRRFHIRPDSVWLRNENLHSKKSNDGSQARIPIVIGLSSSMHERFSFEYDGKDDVLKKIKYESNVYFPGVDENAIKMIDNALIIAANDENLKQFVTKICENIHQHLENAQKSVDKDTKQIVLCLETCLDLK